MRRAAYFCNHCGVMKGEANRWWLLFLVARGPLCSALPKLAGNLVVHRKAPCWAVIGGELRAPVLWPWEEENASHADAHLCGEKCVHALVSRWMQTGTIEPPPPAEVQR